MTKEKRLITFDLNMTYRRPRRNRHTQTIRNLVQENRLSIEQLIYPLFVIEGQDKKEPIASMPGIFRFSTDNILKEIKECLSLGIGSFCLFPSLPDSKKNPQATESTNPDGLYLSLIREIKQQFREACIVTDVAMDPYSSDGHDGLVKDGQILNDETLPILAAMSVAQAQAGADIIAPSDMMDGRVAAIREALDKAGFSHIAIMSYTAKYASAFYGPFRDALDSAPRFGDKKTYQMNPANSREALIEAELDVAEGADFLMVKPAVAYLDIIKTLKDNFNLPIVAYHVSGEYAMIKAAAQNGWINERQVVEECMLSIRRAGASIILTYFAKDLAKWRK